MFESRKEADRSGEGNSALDRALALYRETYGAEPEHVAFAPGRVNLIGDHTDYAGGLVFPAAMTDGCACAVGPDDSVLSAVSGDVGGAASVGVSGSLTASGLAGEPSWFRYAAGTFEVMRRTFAPRAAGSRMAVASDVPSGSGLSSSAALEVSIATALESLWGLEVGDVEKARACQAAEHEFAGTPCGLMDQLVSVVGRRDHAVRIDFADTTWEHVAMPPSSEAVFVLLDSAVKHANDDGGYAARRAACDSVLGTLGVDSLRSVAFESLDALPSTLSDVERDAVTHVVSENRRVERFADALRAGRYAEAGMLMAESHCSLSRTYRVSCREVDTLVSIALEHEGVFGARMTGGGFGGWTVALVRADAAAAVAASVIERYRDATGLESASRVVSAGDGARVLRAVETPLVYAEASAVAQRR